jgi:hypothetical protein
MSFRHEKGGAMALDIPDFDLLVSIHRQDPEAFEHFRRHLLREAVAAAPEIYRHSLEQLLVRIEAVRESACDPTDAALAAFRMMRDSVESLQQNWEQVRYAAADMQARMLIDRLRA